MNRREFLSKTAALGVHSLTQISNTQAFSVKPGESLPDRSEFVVRNAYVMTMDSVLGDLMNADIHVCNGEIIAIGTNLIAPTAENINGQNAIVLPGFIDTHWHLWTALFRSMSGDIKEHGYFTLSERLGKLYKPKDVYRATQLAIAEALYSGITTVHDFNHNVRTLEYAKASIQALANTGIRARFSYGYYKDQPPEEATPFDSIISLQHQMANSQNDLLSLGFASREVSVYKQYFHDWELARKMSLPIAIHASSSRNESGEIAQLFKAGLLGKDVLIIHATVATPTEIEQLAESGAAVSLTPFTEMRTGFGFPPIEQLIAANVLVSFGIDTTALSGNADMFAIMKIMQNIGNAQAKSEFALLPRRVLELATINGAKAMGIADRVGSLKPGKRADLIMVSIENLNMSIFTDPAHLLVEAAQPSNVDTVVVDGRILKRNGHLTALNANQAIQEARNALTAIRQRLNLG